ncbi:semaphorin-7A isoform X2 [Hoplias malabaricus]|uniref:semaphorin-7A isoform X2 n=1 Tax=Hoplias malabaricus TaxID=27720 RepID=UPI003461A02E
MLIGRFSTNFEDDDLCLRVPYNIKEGHTVFFQDGAEKLFIGGTNYVLQVNVSNGHIMENFTLPDNRDHFCNKPSCGNTITVIDKFQNSMLVCGTNGGNPRCWKLHPKSSNHSRGVMEEMDGKGIAPYSYSQNSLCLTVDGDLYAAAPLYKEGTSLQFRRKAGSQTSVWMYDPWITEPTFITAFLARRPRDPVNEKMYVLFREKNPDSSLEADPWISRVARVCKADKGGSKRFFQNIWTSFLKARLVCAIPNEFLYFNRLQDAYVLHAEDWRESRIYALFSSSWNATAVCIYSLADLDHIFENSSFKGYNGEIPSPRPGTCVEDSKSLPMATINVIKQHPEMNQWVQPIQKTSPFYISNSNYTRIVVDRVKAADGKKYNVLFLATDTGKIHKFLEDGSEAFIISEISLYEHSAPVQSMKINSEKRQLLVGYPEQMSVLDLQRCQHYNTSCQDCVLARDPYCAWTENGCTSQIKEGIQNIATGETHLCFNSVNHVTRTKRDTSSSSPVPEEINHTVPMGFPFYLSCPIESHHATYTWLHGNDLISCNPTQSTCLYLIPNTNEGNYGDYTCQAEELDYKKIVKKYNLRSPPQSRSINIAFKISAQKHLLLTPFTLVIMLVF